VGKWRRARAPIGRLNEGHADPAAEIVTTLLTQWSGHIASGVRQMQEAGLVRPTLSPEQMAAAVGAGIQGGVQVVRSTGRIDHLEAVLDLVLDHLRGLAHSN